MSKRKKKRKKWKMTLAWIGLIAVLILMGSRSLGHTGVFNFKNIQTLVGGFEAPNNDELRASLTTMTIKSEPARSRSRVTAVVETATPEETPETVTANPGDMPPEDSIPWQLEELEVPKRIPVLMYHCVNDNTHFKNQIERNLTIPVQTFQRQLNLLESKGYHVVSMDDAYEAMANGKQLPKKPVVLTFDDGAADAYTCVFPILKERKISGTFFVKTASVDKGDGLNWAKAEEMSEAGMQIESHTINHCDLATQSLDQLVAQLMGSKASIEKHLNRPVHFIAYPSGSYNQSVMDLTQQSGYLAGFTTNPGVWRPGNNLFSVKRVRVSRGESLRQFTYELSAY